VRPSRVGASWLIGGVSMLMDTILFQQRYLQFHGYTIAPTPTGYIYVSLPTRPVLGLPTYVLLALVALSIINAATRARWLGTRVIEDPIIVIERVLKALNIEYSRIEHGVEVGGVRIVGQGGSLWLVRGMGETKEAIEVDLKTAITEAVKAGLRQPVSVGVVDYSED